MQWKNRTRGHQKKGIKDLSSEVYVLSKEEDKDVGVATTLSVVSDCSSDHAIGDVEIEMPCVENVCVQRNAVEEENHDIVESSCLGDGDGDSVLIPETTDSQSYKLGDNDDSSEWKVYWDSFYGRSYFYNVSTQESTWEPPLGMEHLAYSYETQNLDELAIEVIEMDACLFTFLVKFSGDFCLFTVHFLFGIQTTEKLHDDLLRAALTDDVPAEQSDDLGGVIECQCETEALEEVSRYYNSGLSSCFIVTLCSVSSVIPSRISH